MSNPADNTPGCPTCGLAWQTRGCSPGACKSDPDGLCVVCTARKDQAKREEGKVGFALCADCSAMMAEKGSAAPSVAHPLPWRWERSAYPSMEGHGGIDHHPHALILVDAKGEEVIGAHGDDWAWVECASPYVRAVTERAGAMEALLRRVADGSDDGEFIPIGRLTYDDVRALIAEIDAAKGGR